MKKQRYTFLTAAAGLLLIASPYFAAADVNTGKAKNTLEYRLEAMQAGLDSFKGTRSIQAKADAKVLLAKENSSDHRKDTTDLPKGIIKRLENGKALPKGIVARFLDGKDDDDKDRKDKDTATTTKDTVAPLVFAIRSDAGTSTASIRFVTNERASAKIRYGTTAALGTTALVNTDLSFKHKVTLSNLSPDTLYQYTFLVTDASGNVRETAMASFRTDKIVPPETDAIAPRIVFALATNVTKDSAKIIWVTNEETKSRLFLGTSTPVSTSSALLVRNDLSYFHEARVDGLASSTTYYYKIQNTDASGNATTESEATFTTRAD